MNVVITNGFLQSTDIATLFGNEPVTIVDGDLCKQLPSLLSALGIYKSATQARNSGRVGKIPEGWNVIKASKKVELFIWNPTE